MNQVRSCLLFCFIFAGAISVRAESAPPAPLNINYAKRCDTLFSRMRAGEVELALVENAKTEVQAIQLLADHGWLFSEEFQLALITVLQNRGIKLPEPTAQFDLAQMPHSLSFAANIKKLLALPEPQFAQFASEVQDKMQAMTLASPTLAERTLAQTRVVRLRSAIALSTQKRMFESVFHDAIRITLIKTVRALLESTTNNSLQVTSLPGFASILLSSALGAPQTVNGVAAGWGYISASASSLNWLGSSFQIALGRVLPKLKMLGFRLPESSLPTHNVRTLLEPYETSLRQCTSRLRDISTKSILSLNPVEIAYLAHLDAIELSLLEQELSQRLAQVGIEPELEALTRSAFQLATAGWRDGELDHVRSGIEHLEDRLNQFYKTAPLLTRITQQIREIQRALWQLREEAARVVTQTHPPELLDKSYLILAKFEGDLKPLMEKGSPDEDVAQWLTEWKKHVLELKKIVMSSAKESRACGKQIYDYLSQLSAEGEET